MDTPAPDTNSAATNESQLEAITKERDEYLDGWQRARADLANFRKLEAERITEAVKYANTALLEDMVHVLDSFDLGIAALEKEGGAEKGLYMIRSQLGDTLKRHGLERIDVHVGDAFDPAIAEALSEVASDAPPGTIATIIEPAYALYGKVIRPARVQLSKGSTN